MGVYIKGMHMPECCDNCDFYDIILCEKPFCVLTTKSGGIGFNPYKGKMEDCPLVEVKAPHGRLIDAEELTSFCAIDNFENTRCVLWREIDDAPTIIAAEGKDNVD